MSAVTRAIRSFPCDSAAWRTFIPILSCKKFPHLAHLQDLRAALQHPSTYEKAAAEVRTWGIVSREPEAPSVKPEDLPQAASPVEAPPGGSLLDRAVVLTPQASGG